MIGDHMTKSTSWSFSGVFCHRATCEVRKKRLTSPSEAASYKQSIVLTRSASVPFEKQNHLKLFTVTSIRVRIKAFLIERVCSKFQI